MRINQFKSFSKLKNQSDEMGTKFVITELRLALSLLDIANHSFNRERRKRLCNDAKRSYELVFQALPHLTLLREDQIEIDATLQELRLRLNRLGIFDLPQIQIPNAG
jgi:hypothetical protein